MDWTAAAACTDLAAAIGSPWLVTGSLASNNFAVSEFRVCLLIQLQPIPRTMYFIGLTDLEELHVFLAKQMSPAPLLCQSVQEYGRAGRMVILLHLQMQSNKPQNKQSKAVTNLPSRTRRQTTLKIVYPNTDTRPMSTWWRFSNMSSIALAANEQR